MDGPVVATFSTARGQPFTPQSLVLALTQGQHNLRFSGQLASGDHSADIVAVALAPVSEPASASLFAAALADYALWRTPTRARR
jgi:hypothetical protein